MPADRHAEYQVLYNLINAPLRVYPFHHLYVENVFPESFYREMMSSFPEGEKLKPIAEERNLPNTMYPNRFIITLDANRLKALPGHQRTVWERLQNLLCGREFAETLMWKFSDTLKQRFPEQRGLSFRSEALLVDDRENYVLGPHTDNPKKVVTALFYLPDDDSQVDLGTTIYVPNNPTFRCPGGPEHPAENFQRVTRMPYRRNALFAFAKTDNSFHGVEQVRSLSARRKLVICDIYLSAVSTAIMSGDTNRLG